MGAWQAAAAWWGCAGTKPRWTSWQLCLRQPCACFSSAGTMRAEQKHHSTNLDPCPGAICKTLHSNTRASYDPQQGASAGKKSQASIGGEMNKSHSVWERLWLKEDEAWGFYWSWGCQGTEKITVYLLTVGKRRKKCIYHNSKYQINLLIFPLKDN